MQSYKQLDIIFTYRHTIQRFGFGAKINHLKHSSLIQLVQLFNLKIENRFLNWFFFCSLHLC